MALISFSIPNLINGVSQQPYIMRLASQCEIQENAYATVVGGLSKRPPTFHIAQLFDQASIPASAFIHTISRDASERYIVVVINGDLKVFDLAGNVKTVTFPDGKTYLANAAPASGFKAVTIADTTLITNTAVKTTMSAAKSATRGVEALLTIVQGVYTTDYTAIIDSTAYTFTTPDSTASNAADHIKTTYIAAQLVAAIGSLTGFTITRVGSAIHIKKADASDFTIAAQDSFGNKAMFVAKGRIQRLTSLPTTAPTGFTVEITGDDASIADNYYVKFTPFNSTLTFDEGVWEETVKPDIACTIDPENMPHGLVRNSDGTFTFKELTWDQRTAGDETSAPNPSFVGKAISDIFFFKNRLGFLADENVILSVAGEFFNFYRDTATTVLDSDQIDLAVSNTKVSILRHAINFHEELLLFSDQTQFVLNGTELLTPRTASIIQATSFESSLSARPVTAGQNAYFAVSRGSFSGMLEYFIQPSTNNTHDAAEITAHVPQYLPSPITKLSASAQENCLAAVAAGKLYVYKYYWNGDQKLQSCWSTFTFGADATVINAEFIESTLYLVVVRSDGVYLESLALAPGQTDAGMDFVTLLDRRVPETKLTITYSSTTGLTTWAFPYALGGPAAIITAGTRTGPSYEGHPTHVVGALIPTAVATATTLTAPGDWTASKVWAGRTYTMKYRFSRPALRDSSSGSAQLPITDGTLQLRSWYVVMAQTGYFRAEVSGDYRDTAKYQFTGRILGSVNDILGNTPLEDSVFRFPILGNADGVHVELLNDSHLPCSFLNAGFEAFYTTRARRV